MKESLLKLSAAISRSIPVNRGKGRLSNLALKVFRDAKPDFTFTCPAIGIRWSACGYPDLLTRHMLFEGMYQEDVIRSISALVRPGDTVFDIGGHHGLMAVIAALAAGPEGKVVSFEPNPIAREHLFRHLDLNGVRNVTVEQVALSNRVGEATFYIQTGEVSWNSSLFRDFVEKENQGKARNAMREITVHTEPLDDYVTRTGLVPNLMKIDTEGADFLILEGARKTLEQHRPSLVLELNPKAAQDAGTTIEEFCGFLGSLAYDIHVLKRSALGYYSFGNLETFNPRRHCDEDLYNAVCIPRPDHS